MSHRAFMVTPIDSSWSAGATANLKATVQADTATRKALKQANFFTVWKRLSRVELGDNVDALWPLFNFGDPAWVDSLNWVNPNIRPDESYANSTINIGIMRNVHRDQNEINKGLVDAWDSAKTLFAHDAKKQVRKVYTSAFWTNIKPPLMYLNLDCQGMDCIVASYGGAVATSQKTRDKQVKDFTDDLKNRGITLAKTAGTIAGFAGLATLAFYAIGAYIILRSRK